MDKIEVSPEELAVEQAAVQVPKKEDIRAEIIADYGFDESTDTERIDKLTDTLFDQRVKTSQAIGQKIKHRNDANELRSKVTEPKPVTQKETADLSSKDLFALIEAKVPQDDVDEVVKSAKALGVSIPEALKDDIVKGILEKRQAHRATAIATNTAPARPGTKKVSDDEILSQALKEDKLPAKGSAEAEALFWAKRKK